MTERGRPRVGVLTDLDEESRAACLQALGALDLELSLPPAEPAGCQVLVGGRPREADLERNPGLEVLLIPFAGLPPPTHALMLSRAPDVAVHNLHHNAAATAEGALGLLLAVARRLLPADRALRAGDWGPRYEDPGTSQILAGKRALILGYGAIGARVARVLRALDVEVVAVRRRPQPTDPAWVRGGDALDALLPEAQLLIVCLPETEATRGLLDARRLAALPRGALLVNVGRGPVIDERALYEALREGQLGGAGLDVWYRYPQDPDARRATQPSAFPFHALEQVVLSPHRVAHGDANEGLRWRAVAQFLRAYAAGEPLPHRVDLAAGY
ncbi:MAG: NAD(P)-dependent oxidoreductase [Planctomycetota bacterium]